jgi:hypothetical protein|tara:strand:+ start:436 stop:1143 length:708 start_codon:yes stop_codon:yes gene_type:complete
MNDAIVKTKFSEKNIAKYFDGSRWGTIGTVFLIIAGIIAYMGDYPTAVFLFALACVCFYFAAKAAIVKDNDIDELWTNIAIAREDEAYRVAHIDKEDAVRDAQWFFAFPDDISGGIDYKNKTGDDKCDRRNYQKLVYMIYAKDQLIIFSENICIQNQWDGADKTEEYYWKDVSSVSFDQKEDSFLIVCGGHSIKFPLSGDGKEDSTNENSVKSYKVRAEEVSNGLRMMLREKKSE